MTWKIGFRSNRSSTLVWTTSFFLIYVSFLQALGNNDNFNVPVSLSPFLLCVILLETVDGVHTMKVYARKWGGGGICAETGYPLKLPVPSPTNLDRLDHFPPASQARCSIYMSFLWSHSSVLCAGEPADEPAGEHQRVEPRDGEEQHEHPPRLHQHRPPPGQGAGHRTGPIP